MKELDPQNVLETTDRIGSNLSFSHTERNNSSVCLLDLAHEQATSIATLVDDRIAMGSAYALLRCCIEAYIRGSWLQHCASDDQVKKYTYKNAKWPKLSKQFSDLEEHYQTPGAFKRYMGSTMGRLDALTHGLSEQILKRRNGNRVGHLPEKEETQKLLREVALISVLSHIGIAAIAQNQEALKELSKLSGKF